MTKKINALIVFLFLSTTAFCQIIGSVESVNDKLNEFLNVRDFCISNDGDEMYFTIQSPFQEISQIVVMKKVKGKWSDPVLMSFSDKYLDLEPFLSPDQTKLYFVSNRPLHNLTDPAKDYDIWWVERKNKNNPWSKPVNLGSPVNSTRDEFYPSVSNNHNLYFTSESPTGIGKGDIYFCKWQGNIYSQPALLDTNVNSAGDEFNAFISRNEDLLLFTKYNSPGGMGSGDLYIARKEKDDKWGKAENLGAVINTRFMEYCPFYDEKNEILYFTSRRSSMQPKRFKDVLQFKQTVSSGENGLSKIYKIQFSTKK